MRSFTVITVVGLLLWLLTATAQETTPPAALDEAWVNACAQAAPGTDFFDRCQEILAAGPGSGPRRSEAALGNNLGTTAAQGRAANRLDETRRDEGGVDYEEDFGRLSMHFNAGYRAVDRDQSTFENGFDSDFYRFNGGLDYRLGDTWNIGGVLGYQTSDTVFDNLAGDMETSAWSLTGVLMGQVGDHGHVQFHAGHARLDYDNRRNIRYDIVLNAGEPDEETRSISAVATSSTDGDQLFAGATFGLGGHRKAFSYEAAVSLDYLDTDIDGYTEQGGGGLALRVGDQSITSLRGAVQARITYTRSVGWGVLRPYVRLRFEHEFDDDSRVQAPSFAADPSGFGIVYETEAPDRNYAVIGAGVSGVMLSGNAWYAETQRLVLHDFFSDWAINTGLRIEF